MSDPRQGETDPRHALAQKHLRSAHEQLRAKESEQARQPRRRQRETGERPGVAMLVPSVAASVYVHLILLSVLVVLALSAFIWLYFLINVKFVLGRVIALPTGMLVFLTLSYASVCMLGVIESTSEGRTTLDHAVWGGWLEWFWSLPTTLGMLAIALAAGYGLSRLAPDATGRIMVGTVLLVYPVLQLSTLERGLPFAPLSASVARSLLFQPVAWVLFYAASVALWTPVALLFRLAWTDPPFVTAIVVGPVATVALFVYGWLLGQLAVWVSASEAHFHEE